jgi:hypothetical protein
MQILASETTEMGADSSKHGFVGFGHPQPGSHPSTW